MWLALEVDIVVAIANAAALAFSTIASCDATADVVHTAANVNTAPVIVVVLKT